MNGLSLAMDRYDEDIYDNPFFITLTSQYSSLYEQATSKRWTLCIPRYASVVKETFTEEDVRDHIVFTKEEETSLFETWTGKKLKILNGSICILNTEPTKTVSILFEEIFYNNNNESFQVLCVNCMLNRTDTGYNEEAERITKRPANFSDCRELLFGHPGGKKSEDTLIKLLESFGNSYSRLQGESFRSLIDAANAQFTKAMQTVLKDATVRRKAQHSQTDMDNLKIAVEIYSMHALHRPLFQTLTSCVSSQDAEINKMVRNSAEIQLKDLGIRKEFTSNIIQAKKELVKINKFSTPIGRLGCLKRVVAILTKPSTSNDDDDLLLTTDDFLPILILLIVKSEIPNWNANMMYMKHFHFSKKSEDDEFSFYLTTIEAALEHIRSGHLREDAIKSHKIKMTENSDNSGVSRPLSGGTSVVDKFFQFVQYGDETSVKSMLRKPKDSQDEISHQLCHPLCSCSKCAKLVAQNHTDINLVTAYSRDDRGYTALHMAALYGQAHLIDVLIQNGAVVNASDYLGYTPIHLACQKGYQNIILLLVHFGADCTETDGEGNTALHLCVDNGHEDCVKAMVFLDNVKTRIDVNAQNFRGDTALHLAAKWGYENIVSILLENDALPNVKNRKKQTPFNIAQSTKVQEILKMVASLPQLQMHVSRRKSLADYTIVSKKSRAPDLSSSPQSPTTPVVASLDEVENKQLEKLYKAISDGDLPMIKYHLGWNDLDDDDDLDPSSSPKELCHPLCQCPRCLPVQKVSSTGRNGIHINTQNKTGYSPLHQAVLKARIDFVKLFLRRGANVNMQTKKNITPLHLACFLRENEIAKYLVQNDASVNMKDGAGDTPLHICCAKANIEMLNFLTQYAANINQVNLCGNTPLHIAVQFKKLDAVKWLLSQGPNVTITNRQKLTPLQMAKEQDIQTVIETYIKNHLGEVKNFTADKSLTESNGTSIHDLFAAFEAKDLQYMNNLNTSIRTFDAKKSLRKTKLTRDASIPNLNLLKQTHSIQKFDLSALKSVTPMDKSDPLHIYRISVNSSDIPSNASNNGNFESSLGQIPFDQGDDLAKNGISSNEKTMCNMIEGQNIYSSTAKSPMMNPHKSSGYTQPSKMFYSDEQCLCNASENHEDYSVQTIDMVDSCSRLNQSTGKIRNLVDRTNSLTFENHHSDNVQPQSVLTEEKEPKSRVKNSLTSTKTTEVVVGENCQQMEQVTLPIVPSLKNRLTKTSETIVLSDDEFFDTD